MEGKEYYTDRFTKHVLRIVACNNLHPCVSKNQMAWVMSAVEEFETCENMARLQVLCQQAKFLSGTACMDLHTRYTLREIAAVCDSSAEWIRNVILTTRRAFRRAELRQETVLFPWESD